MCCYHLNYFFVCDIFIFYYLILFILFSLHALLVCLYPHPTIQSAMVLSATPQNKQIIQLAQCFIKPRPQQRTHWGLPAYVDSEPRGCFFSPQITMLL